MGRNIWLVLIYLRLSPSQPNWDTTRTLFQRPLTLTKLFNFTHLNTRSEHKDQTEQLKCLPIFTKPWWGWQVCCHAPDARHWDGGRSWNLGTQSNYSPQMRKTLNRQVSTLMICNIDVKGIIYLCTARKRINKIQQNIFKPVRKKSKEYNCLRFRI